jgi:exodeoxyribonuclease VII small subunit
MESEGLGFDAVLTRLREVVEHLESGDLSLEDALKAYEQGVALAQRGHQILDGAEKRIEVLMSTSGGAVTAVPLDDDGKRP